MVYKRGQTYWYKFAWSIRQRDGTSRSFLIRRSARTKIDTEAEEAEHEHRRAIRLGEVHPLDPWPKPLAPEAPVLRDFTTRFLEYARLHVKRAASSSTQELLHDCLLFLSSRVHKSLRSIRRLFPGLPAPGRLLA